MPAKIVVPVPALTKFPLVPDITPLYVVSLLLPPAVSVKLPRAMLPAPAIEPTVSLAPSV